MEQMSDSVLALIIDANIHWRYFPKPSYPRFIVYLWRANWEKHKLNAEQVYIPEGVF